jgi:hypothetical protein
VSDVVTAWAAAAQRVCASDEACVRFCYGNNDNDNDGDDDGDDDDDNNDFVGDGGAVDWKHTLRAAVAAVAAATDACGVINTAWRTAADAVNSNVIVDAAAAVVVSSAATAAATALTARFDALKSATAAAATARLQRRKERQKAIGE